MIEWNPAYQDPPNTGSLGADIPDLSNFENVWDQSYFHQQQHIWVAPVHQPEPQIMTKPEYAHYNTDDYNPELLYPRHSAQIEETQHYQEYHHNEEEYHHHEEENHQFEEEYSHHEEEHHHHEERNHEEEHNHKQDHHHEESNPHQPRLVHPPSFPWDSIPDHFPAPTRVWLPADQQRQWPEERTCKYSF